MAVIDFSPSVLYASVVSEGYVDANGNKHPGTVTYHEHVKCDVVPAGQANQKDFGDGVLQTYAFTIYIHDMSCKDFALGERIKFKKDGVLSKEYHVKGFHRYQLQCKIWI